MPTEYERIREQIAQIIKSAVGRTNPDESYFKPISIREAANQILSLDGIEIKSDDQSLPESPYSPPLDTTQIIWDEIVVASQQDMRKADFIKVIPKI
jgi:hypothetical protein